MITYLRILALCALAGYLLATVFTTPGGADAGAAKGLLVGVLVAWGEWKFRRHKAMEQAAFQHALAWPATGDSAVQQKN